MEENPQIESGEAIDARWSQGLVYRPTGPVTQNYGPVTYQMPRPLRMPLDLPERAEHFQDRKDELAQLLVDLQPHSVVTLCGPGGMGKSALAAEAVWALADSKQLLERFPDGVLLHKFYTNRQVAVLMENIARVFGEELKPSPQEAAKRALSGRRVLLLLDGTEEADDLRAILEIRGESGVLITSRSRKDARVIRHDLPPLPPDEAVALLQAWGGQQAENYETSQQISQLVGRLPLALRLVGHYLSYSDEKATHYLAWLAETPLMALDHGKRQDESVPLLLERSLAQVSEQARQVLGVVGLLARAPFDGAAIAAALAFSERETRQALGELVNYGLLIRQEVGYEISHALIHTYARQRLAPSDEVVVRLASYYKQEVNVHSDDFPYLHTLRPHIMALLSIANERKIWEIVSDLAGCIDNYLNRQGYWSDRLTSLTLHLSADRMRKDRQSEGSVLGRLGSTNLLLSRVQPAIDFYQQALSIAKEIGDRNNEGTWLGNLGNVHFRLGQVQPAIDFYQQALSIAREIGDYSGESTWLGSLGNAHRNLGQFEPAIDFYQQALYIAQEIGDRSIEGTCLGNLGIVYFRLGQVQPAIDFYQQALSIAKEIADYSGEGAWLGSLGNAHRNLGRFEPAINFYQRALSIAKEIGDRRSEGTWLGGIGNVYNDFGQFEPASDFYQQAIVIAQEIGDRGIEGTWLGNLGNAYRNLGQFEPAIDSYQQAIVIAQEIGDRSTEGAWFGGMGNVYAELGQFEPAIDFYQQAIVIAKEIGDRSIEGTWLGNLGNVYLDLDQVEQVIDCFQQALAIAQEIGDRHNEGNWLGNLGNAYLDLGQFEPAIDFYQQAIVIAKEIGDGSGEGTWLGNLGNAHYNLGQVPQAIDSYQQAIIIAQEIGDRNGEGTWLGNLGNAYLDLGQFDQARHYYQQALQIYEDIQSPDADEVRELLESLEE